MPDPNDLTTWAQQTVNGYLSRGPVPQAPTSVSPEQGSILGGMIKNRIDYAAKNGLGNVVTVKKKRSTPQLIPLSRPQGQ